MIIKLIAFQTTVSGPKTDPCSKLSCPPYATCKSSFDGNSASCHCPSSCSSNQLSQETVVCGKFIHINIDQLKFHLKFRCKLKTYKSSIISNNFKIGSDGREYPSRCHLEQSACEKSLDHLEVVSNGRCNPCQEYKCDSPRECHVILSPELNNTRVPKCMCNNDCPRSSLEGDIGYVCASNGKTVSLQAV